jgi:hypothetical protein
LHLLGRYSTTWVEYHTPRLSPSLSLLLPLSTDLPLSIYYGVFTEHLLCANPGILFPFLALTI